MNQDQNTVKKKRQNHESGSEELKSFIYAVSHDLRAPLRAIHGFSTVLEEKISDQLDATNLHYLHRILENVNMMTRQMDALLQLSRVANMELNYSRIDTEDMILSVNEELTSSDKNIDLEMGELPQISGDRKLIARCFKQLIANAIKFSSGKDHPRIKVSGKSENEQTIISIEDNGVGFDPKYSDKLFLMFQRLHDEDEFEGIGAGLALVKKIIDMHDGRVWAESTPGEGATFYLSIPNLTNNE